MNRLLAITALLITLVACGPTKRAGEAAGHTAIDCAKQDVSAAVKTSGLPLLGEVVSIVGAGGAGWQDALGRLGTELGEKALACAVEAARAGYAASGGANFAGPSPADRAAGYERIRGWKFSQ